MAGSDDPSHEERTEKFTRYVQPEIPVLLRAAASLTPQAADAEDLVQDTLVRAWQALDRFDGAHPRAWLLTILRRTELNRNRRTRPQLVGTLSTDSLDAAPFLGASTPDSPDDAAVALSFHRTIADAFERLPEKQREVVQLVDVEGLGYAEAAREIGVPIGTVESRLHRARARIRGRLVEIGLARPRR